MLRTRSGETGLSPSQSSQRVIRASSSASSRKWTGRFVLCGIALICWVITYWERGAVPEFLTGLVGSAWGCLFISREVEKRKEGVNNPKT